MWASPVFWHSSSIDTGPNSSMTPLRKARPAALHQFFKNKTNLAGKGRTLRRPAHDASVEAIQSALPAICHKPGADCRVWISKKQSLHIWVKFRCPCNNHQYTMTRFEARRPPPRDQWPGIMHDRVQLHHGGCSTPDAD